MLLIRLKKARESRGLAWHYRGVVLDLHGTARGTWSDVRIPATARQPEPTSHIDASLYVYCTLRLATAREWHSIFAERHVDPDWRH